MQSGEVLFLCHGNAFNRIPGTSVLRSHPVRNHDQERTARFGFEVEQKGIGRSLWRGEKN